MKVYTPHFFALLIFTSCTTNRESLKEECLRTLSGAASSSDFWVRVHAIEYLTALGYKDEARSRITAGLEEFESTPQKRIGFWRCNYQVSVPEQKAVWMQKIIRAYVDRLGPDRIHAAETLSKLGVPLRDIDMELVAQDIKNGGMLASYVLWGSALPTRQDEGRVQYNRLIDELYVDDVDRRQIAAYALGYIGDIPDEVWSSFARAAMSEPTASKAYPYFIGAAFSTLPDESRKDALADSLHQRLTSLKNFNSREAKVELCRALAKKGRREDSDLLLLLLREQTSVVGGVSPQDEPSNVDVRSAAAFAIMSIINKDTKFLIQ